MMRKWSPPFSKDTSFFFSFFFLVSDTFRGSLSRCLAAPPFPTLLPNLMSGVSGVTRRLCAPFYLLLLYLIPDPQTGYPSVCRSAHSPVQRPPFLCLQPRSSLSVSSPFTLAHLLAAFICVFPSPSPNSCALPSLCLSQIMAICLLFPPQKSPGRSSVCLSQDFFFPLLILLQLLLPGCLILGRASKRKRVKKKKPSKLIPNPVPKWILFFLLQIFFCF